MELVKREDHYALYDDNGHKIAASIDGCKYKLSEENCGELFWNKPAIQDPMNEYVAEKHTQEECLGFIDGFEKAMELQKDKLFTVEDINFLKWIFDRLEFLGDSHISYEMIKLKKLIQSLQQPTEIAVEIEMGNILDTKLSIGATSIQDANHVTITRSPKLDENGCLILKKL